MKLRVHYNQNQQVYDNDCYSPSAGKPEQVLNEWLKIGGIEVVESKKASPSTLALAHDINYVRDVLACVRVNGFGNKNPNVARSLPFTTGSLISAATDAMLQRTVTSSLTSGFHHACWDHGGGYCSFNGILVTAQYLKLHGFVNRVGILDCDQHHLNGCIDIMKKLNLDYIDAYDVGGVWANKTGKQILKEIPKVFKNVFSKCDIVIVQLGADSCVEDDLGHTFTKEQMLERDRIVFQQLKKYNLPAATTLAGGYRADIREVLELHNYSLQAWKEVYGVK